MLIILIILFILSLHYYTKTSQTQEYKEQEQKLKQATEELKEAIIQEFKIEQIVIWLNDNIWAVYAMIIVLAILISIHEAAC